MISCRKATELISKEMDEPLSRWETFSLKAHLLVCWCCNRFKKQIHIINNQLKEIASEIIAFERFAEIDLPDLSQESKERILKVLRNTL